MPDKNIAYLGICDNNSLLHPRADKHEQTETCENWRPCAPVLTQPSDEGVCRKKFDKTCRSASYYPRHGDYCYCGLAEGHAGERVCIMCGWPERESERPVLPNYAEIQEFVHAELGHANTTVVNCIQKWEIRTRASSPAVVATRNEILQALREAIDCYKDLLREVKYPHVDDHAAVCKWGQVLRPSSPAVAPADTPVCSKCKTRLKYFGNEIEPCVNCGGTVAGRMQGDWEDWRGQLLDAWRHDYRATMNALLEGGPALRESAREAPSKQKQQFIELVRGIMEYGIPEADAKAALLYLTHEGILKLNRDWTVEASPEDPAAPKEK